MVSHIKKKSLKRYCTSITYDANGNIESLAKNGNLGAGNEPMDRLTYAYKPGTNQFTSVSDEVPAPRYDNDIDSQEGDNYDYDEIGNLTADAQGEIGNIEWTVRGKIKEITRTEESTKPDLEFDYGPMGNRIMKRVTPYESEPVTTYYIRDAEGNLMATYEVQAAEEEGDWFFLKDQYFYGSSRLGSYTADTAALPSGTHPDSNRYERILGKKQFELTNHLGNVLATVSDQKIATNDNGEVDYFLPKVVSYSSYYPFGMKQPGMYGSLADYKHGFQGQEKDDEIAGVGNSYTAMFWQYDPRLGRRWNVDPITLPWQSTFACFNNNPIVYVDPLGLFGTRKEARQYRKKHGITGRIRKNDDGHFSIDNRKQRTSIWNDPEFGISKAVHVEVEKVPGKLSDLPSDLKVIYDPLSSVEREDIDENIPAIILHRTVSSSGKNLYDAWKSKKKVAGTHFLVGEEGTIYQTGNLQKYTIHLLSDQKSQMYSKYFGKILNSNTIGIEVIGNYNDKTKTWDPLTPAQVKATAELILELTYLYNLELHNLLPHEKVQRKTPGEGQTVLDAVIQKVKQNW